MGDLTFWVEGDPAPQGSKSRTRYGGMFESSHRLKDWRATVAMTALVNRKKVAVRTENVRVELRFVTRIDADIDKLCRGCLDGLTEGGIFPDDKVVTDLRASKRKRAKGETPGCFITIGDADVGSD